MKMKGESSFDFRGKRKTNPGKVESSWSKVNQEGDKIVRERLAGRFLE